jgi:hypothetical protein
MPQLPRRELAKARERRFAPQKRFVDLAIEVTDGARVFRYGGCWDTGVGQMIGPPESYAVRTVTEQQFDVITYAGTEPIILSSGGIGAGKTTVGCDAPMPWFLSYPGAKFWWVAPTYRTCRVGYRKMLERLPPHWVARASKNEKEMMIELVNGTTIDFRSAIYQEHLESDDCRGIIGDEVGRFSVDVRQQLRGRIARNLGPGRIWYQGTPTDDIEEMLLSLEQPDKETGAVDGKVFHLDSRRNRFVDAANFDRLRGVVDAREFERIVGGRLVKRPGRVAHGFEVRTHMRPLPDIGAVVTASEIARRFPGARGPHAGVVTSWDFTVARGRPMIAQVLQAVKADGEVAWWCIDELASTNSSVAQHARRVRDKLMREHGYGGHGAIAIVEHDVEEIRQNDVWRELSAAGFLVRGAEIGKKTSTPQQAAADALNGMLSPVDGIPRLYVDPRCGHTKRALQLLMWSASGGLEHGSTYPNDLALAGDALMRFAWRFADPERLRLYATS